MNLFKSVFKAREEDNIKKALMCNGWTTATQLTLVAKLLRSTESLDGDILEIGSAWGRSTVMMGLSSRKKIWSIDPHTGGIAYILRNEDQGSFEEFQGNIKQFNLSKRIHILKTTTRDVIDNKLIGETVKFSFAYIDGLHTAEGVKTDIEFVLPRLVKNGIVVFDDYFKQSVIDMKKMIDERVDKHKLTLVKKKECGLVYFKK